MKQNPYDAPRAAVDDAPEEYQPVRILATSGRIGRARYVLYTIGLPILIFMLIGIVSGALGGSGVAAVVMVVGSIAIVVLSIMLTIQRCHDFDASGWLALVWVIPLVNLIFWFIPGTDGANRFGAKTPPNSTGVLVAVWILPALALVGIIAAVSIPAYQDYAKRAQTKQVR